MGFCVASTKNGSARRCRTRPTVTCRSCMASRRAAWVLGGVRLISSARITLANNGPSRSERVGQAVPHPADGHLPLLHGFEEGSLGLGGSPVDLVGEDHVGEQRPLQIGTGRPGGAAPGRRSPAAPAWLRGGQPGSWGESG